MSSSIHDAKTFWPAFIADLKKAEGHVIIQSPFLSYPRIDELAPHFRVLAKRGVAICVLVQQPVVHKFQREQDAELDEFCKPRAFKDLCEILTNLSVHVTPIKQIHAKLAMIDRKFLWEGSLNILSHTKAKEHMRRWDDRTELEAVANLHQLKRCGTCHENRMKYALSGTQPSRLTQLGRLIVNNRKNLNLSQRQLADSSGISRQRICEIEQGLNVKVETLLSLTDNLNVEALLVPDHYVSAVCNLIQSGRQANDIQQTSKNHRKHTEQSPPATPL